MEEKIIEEVKKFVEAESLKNDRGYHKEWMIHLKSVSANALELANKLNAEKEDHHITGTEIAERKLRELNYPEDKIRSVKHCILSHRGSKNIKRETVEAQIVADADAMAHFELVGDLIKAEFVLGGISNESLAQQLVKEKLTRSWKKLSSEGKVFAESKYHFVLNNLNL